MIIYILYTLFGIATIAGMIVYLTKSTKTIACKNCNQEFGAIPNKNMTIVSVFVFWELLIAGIFIFGHGISFMCLLAGITVIYYLFKKEGYKCPNCKTINQLS